MFFLFDNVDNINNNNSECVSKAIFVRMLFVLNHHQISQNAVIIKEKRSNFTMLTKVLLKLWIANLPEIPRKYFWVAKF